MPQKKDPRVAGASVKSIDYSRTFFFFLYCIRFQYLELQSRILIQYHFFYNFNLIIFISIFIKRKAPGTLRLCTRIVLRSVLRLFGELNKKQKTFYTRVMFYGRGLAVGVKSLENSFFFLLFIRVQYFDSEQKANKKYKTKHYLLKTNYLTCQITEY